VDLPLEVTPQQLDRELVLEADLRLPLVVVIIIMAPAGMTPPSYLLYHVMIYVGYLAHAK